jgi:hypothetical protein
VLLTVFVGFGVLTTSLVQADETLNITAGGSPTVKQSGSRHISSALLGFDLFAKLQAWQAELSEDNGGRGLHLAMPFGVKGPALRLSNTVPDRVIRGLRAGGDRRVGALGDANPDAYVFLEKRW